MHGGHRRAGGNRTRPGCQDGRREVGDIRGRRDPLDPRVAAEPDALAAGELPGAAHGEVERGVERRLVAPQERQRLLVADRLRGGARDAGGPRRERGHLVERGRRRACAAKRCSMRSPTSSRGIQSPTSATSIAGGPYGVDAGAERRERAAPVVRDHFERADDAAPVVRFDARRRDRIDRAAGGRTRSRGRPRVSVSRRNAARVVEVLRRGSRGRRRPPGRTARCRRRATPGCRALRSRRSRPAPAAGVRTTDQSSSGSATSIRWCGTAARSARRRLGRADVHRAVHLHRVERDDLDVAGLRRDCERERRLAGRGRTDEREMTAHAGDADDRDPDASSARRAAPGATKSPRSQCGAACVMRGVDVLAGREPRRRRAARRGRACCGGCGPTTPSGPSSTARRGALPRRRRGAPRVGASAEPSTTSVSCSMRSCTTSGGTKSSTKVAASVPGRGEKTNVYAAS